MAGLILEIESVQGNGDWQPLALRTIAGTGTPLASATANGSGEDHGDEYELTFTSVVAGDHATVKVQTGSPDNPYNDPVGKLVSLDGTTAYRNIVGGVDLVFSVSGSFTGSWSITVITGYSFGPRAGFGAGAGQASEMRRIRVRNDDTDAAQNVTASIARRVKPYATSGQVFARVFPFAPGAMESLTGEQVQPYAITLENVTGSGSSKTGDLKVNGATVSVENVTTPGSGTSVGLNVTDDYRVTAGVLTDFEFQLSELMTNAATANVLVFDPRFTQIAPDVGDAPGDFGTDDVLVTQEGQADGVILPGEFGFVWARCLVPEGSLSRSNPHPLDFMVQAQQGSAAPWAA